MNSDGRHPLVNQLGGCRQPSAASTEAVPSLSGVDKRSKQIQVPAAVQGENDAGAQPLSTF
jgi:hypothetical protein